MNQRQPTNAASPVIARQKIARIFLIIAIALCLAALISLALGFYVAHRDGIPTAYPPDFQGSGKPWKRTPQTSAAMGFAITLSFLSILPAMFAGLKDWRWKTQSACLVTGLVFLAMVFLFGLLIA